MQNKIISKIQSIADEKYAQTARRFFKTNAGEYSAGDIFIGIRVPDLRRLARDFQDVSTADLEKLLARPEHEIRMFALMLMIRKFNLGASNAREQIVKIYLDAARAGQINNWDLVDLSAKDIIGKWGDVRILNELAASENMWENRIAIIATHNDIRDGNLENALRLSQNFLSHPHDLMHKAVGWTLREVGKKDEPALRNFLDTHLDKMPRTTLRYAIERFPESLRKEYLKK